MHLHRLILWNCALNCAMGIACWTAPVAAEPLWMRLVPGKAVDADPNHDYALSADHGPWMIMATSLSGKGAPQQARELVLELRRRYKLEAYVHEMEFDFTEPVSGRGIDKTGQPQRMRYMRNQDIHEIAIMVGNFASVNDPEGQETLRKVKLMKPVALDPSQRGKTSQSLALLRAVQSAMLPDGDQRKQKGPMGKAFMTRNPLLPQDFFTPKGIDEFVERLNSDVKYSLLKCPGKYTVQVGTFTGKVVIDPKEVQAYETGKQMTSRLLDAGDNAEKMCAALRQKGYEAYVLHDRYASIVTVGSFESVGAPRLDGKIEINPKIHAILQSFSAQPLAAGEIRVNDPHALTSMKPRTIVGVPFDLQPQIVEVPQRSISKDYARQ